MGLSQPIGGAVLPLEGEPRIEARDIWMEFVGQARGTRHAALREVSFSIGDGEFVTIVGPSGSGKTTLLNMAAGLLQPTGGMFLISRQRVTGPGRNRSFVFQDASLLPWRTVLGNVLYGIECRGDDPRAARDRALKLIELVGLKGFERFYPHQLSGGMRQRANLGRALLYDPEVLLMDEPFAALDAQTREAMQGELLRIWQQTQRTVMFVTHQIDEAVYLSDRVLVLSTAPGRLLADIRIDVPRPRALSLKREEVLVRYEREIWNLIKPSVPHG